MSTTIMAACWPLQMSPTQKAVLISLADNANDQGWAWPSLTTIGERTCLSERAVQNAIRWLEDTGVVVADRSNGRHTKYQVRPDGYQTPARRAPPHDVHPRTTCVGTPAPAAGDPRTTCVQPPHDVPSNRQEPSIEPSKQPSARTGRSRSRKPASGETTLDEWMPSLGEDEFAVPEGDQIVAWAVALGIPADWVGLAWMEFEDRHAGKAKRQADWRATFRNFVRRGWLDVWRPGREGGWYLTTTGEQWRRQRDAQQATGEGGAS